MSSKCDNRIVRSSFWYMIESACHAWDAPAEDQPFSILLSLNRMTVKMVYDRPPNLIHDC